MRTNNMFNDEVYGYVKDEMNGWDLGNVSEEVFRRFVDNEEFIIDWFTVEWQDFRVSEFREISDGKILKGDKQAYLDIACFETLMEEIVKYGNLSDYLKEVKGEIL